MWRARFACTPWPADVSLRLVGMYQHHSWTIIQALGLRNWLVPPATNKHTHPAVSIETMSPSKIKAAVGGIELAWRSQMTATNLRQTLFQLTPL